MIFLFSVQVPASPTVSPLLSSVTISRRCCRGLPEITPRATTPVPGLQMETCCTVTARSPPAPSRPLNVERFTISLSRPRTGPAAAPSVSRCRVEQVRGLRVMPAYCVTYMRSRFTPPPPLPLSLSLSLVPCPPGAVDVQPLPMEREIQVMHFSWTQIACGDVEYKLELTGSLPGDGEAQFELSSYWTSGTYFEIPLPCGSSFSAAVESRNAAGTSVPSGPLNRTTGEQWSLYCSVYVILVI